jgi:D-ribose pyranose/furanose isomerase RbsD
VLHPIPADKAAEFLMAISECRYASEQIAESLLMEPLPLANIARATEILHEAMCQIEAELFSIVRPGESLPQI